MSTYTPNISDPRTLKRFESALHFVVAYHSSSGKPRFLSKRLIDSFFGQQQNPVSKFLRKILLIDSGEKYIIEEKCKQYFFRQTGEEYIRSVVKQGNREDYSSWMKNWNKKFPSVSTLTEEIMSSNSSNFKRQDIQVVVSSILSVLQVPFTDEEYNEAAEAIAKPFIHELQSGKFTYKDASNRYWHPLQLVNTKTRRIIQAKFGFVHNYDIEACAPTLLLQYARHNGLTEQTPFIDLYLNRKTEIRKQLSEQTGAEIDDVKKVINSLFNGGKINTTHFCKVFSMLNKNRVITEKFKINNFIIGLQNDIKKIWDILTPKLERRVKVDLKTGKVRKCPFSGKDKSPLYYMLERQVQKAANEYMESYVRTSVFLEHDGWVTRKEISLEELQNHIKSSTGFSVKIDYERM